MDKRKIILGVTLLFIFLFIFMSCRTNKEEIQSTPLDEDLGELEEFSADEELSELDNLEEDLAVIDDL